MTAPTPREVLADALLTAHFQHMPDCDLPAGCTCHFYADLATVRAALTRREPQTLTLDVERLALALDEWRPMLKAWLKPKGVQPSTRQTADTIAAEYARLEAADRG